MIHLYRHVMRHGCRVSAQSGQCVPIQTAAQLLLLLLQASDQYLLHQVGAAPMNVAAIADYHAHCSSNILCLSEGRPHRTVYSSTDEKMAVVGRGEVRRTAAQSKNERRRRIENSSALVVSARR